MSIEKSSLILGLVNKLDVREERFDEAIKSSFFIKSINAVFECFQSFTSNLQQSSLLVENIDFLLMIGLSLAIVSILFAPTGIIGLCTLAAFVLLLLKFCIVKGKKYDFNSFDLPVFLYIAIAGLSVAFSSLLFPSLKGYIKMLVYFGGYLTFSNLFKENPKRIIWLMSVLAISASVEAFYAIYQQIVGVESLASWQDSSNVNPEQLMNRVYGSLKPFNPNLLAGYLVAAFSSVLGLAFWFLNKKNWRISIAAFIGTAAILIAIICTGSRGAYMALTGMLTVFVLISGHIISYEYKHIKWLKKLWLAGIILAIAAVIAAVLISPALQHRVLSIFALRDDSSNSYRMNVYAACAKIFKDNWLIGIGTGNTTFRLIYGLYMITGFDALGAYCVPLETAVESGIFGLLIFGWLIILSFIRGAKYIIKDNLLENKILASSCIIGITGLMIHGMVDTVWYRPQINLIFWMSIAILGVITSKSHTSVSFNPPINKP